MAESWATLTSYRLHDLLMFSAETYYRLFELVNRRWWPAPLGGGLLAVGLWMVASARRAARVTAGLLALAWAGVALLYFRDGFAAIHWLGPWWLWAFLLQAVAGLLVTAKTRLGFDAQGATRALGLALMLAAVAWPLLALSLQRTAWRAEVLGLAPDATVLLSLGWLLCVAPPRYVAAALLPVPVAWCLFSGTTLWAMQQPHAWFLPLAAVLASSALLRRQR
jgi:hypothetical protein